MRGSRRRKKVRPNYKRIVGALLVLILIIVGAVFGIKSITQNAKQGDIGQNNNNQVEEESVPEDITINLVAIGDVMCHSQNFKTAYNTTTKTYDFSPAFKNVAKYITKADVAIRKLRDNICRRSKRL